MLEIIKVHEYDREPCTVDVAMLSRGRWVASGDYMGKPFSGEGRTKDQALASWRTNARRHHN